MSLAPHEATTAKSQTPLRILNTPKQTATVAAVAASVADVAASHVGLYSSFLM